jgi:hypothetical protein
LQDYRPGSVITAVIRLAMNSNSFLIPLIFTLLLQLPASAQDAEAPKVKKVQVGLQMKGLTEPYILVDRKPNGSTIYRKLVGDNDKYEFTKFRRFVAMNEKFDTAVVNLLNSEVEELRGFSWHGPVLVVAIQLEHGVRRYEFDGMPIEYFTESWSDLIRNNPANDIDLDKNLSAELRKVTELALNFQAGESKPWVGEKCNVHIPQIRRGASKHSNWKFPLSFSHKIQPMNLTFSMDWIDLLAKEPDGIVDLGEYYGYYQLTPVITHPK